MLFDLSHFGKQYGDCIEQPPSIVKRGEIVRAKFVSGHPRNNLLHGRTFLAIEQQKGNNWVTVATDANWETKYLRYFYLLLYHNLNKMSIKIANYY